MSIKKIAYLGLGIMGRSMASNLLKAGYNVTVWNRTASRADALTGEGAKRADTPAGAVQDAELIMYCMSDEAAVEEVVFGEDGILMGTRKGQIAVDLSTVHPSLSHKEAAAYAGKDVDFVDAPVFGSKNEAAGAGLWIVAGGKREVFDRVEPVLAALSENVH